MPKATARRVKIAKKGNTMTVGFPTGVTIGVDLRKVKMTRDQRLAVGKLLRKAKGITMKECTGDDCPAGQHLAPEEFASIRKLRSVLGTGGGMNPVAGPIVDFCLHVINVAN